jgi:hypothetical protein
MKKLTLLFICVLTLSCSLTMDQIYNWDKVNMNYVPNYVVDLNTLLEFVYGNGENGFTPYIQFNQSKAKSVRGKCNYFPKGIQLPNETLEKMSGICGDQAVLFLALYHKLFHKKGQLIIGRVAGTISVGHTYPFVNGHNYNFDIEIDYQMQVINYDDIGWFISEYHYY